MASGESGLPVTWTPPPKTLAVLPLIVTFVSLTVLLSWRPPSTATAPPASAVLLEKVLKVTTAVPVCWNRPPPRSALLSLKLVLRMVTVSPSW